MCENGFVKTFALAVYLWRHGVAMRCFTARNVYKVSQNPLTNCETLSVSSKAENPYGKTHRSNNIDTICGALFFEDYFAQAIFVHQFVISKLNWFSIVVIGSSPKCSLWQTPGPAGWGRIQVALSLHTISVHSALKAVVKCRADIVDHTGPIELMFHIVVPEMLPMVSCQC